MATDFPFKNRLEAGMPPVELTFDCRPVAPVELDLEGREPLYASPDRTPAGESITYLFKFAQIEVLRFTRVCDFFIDDARIDGRLRLSGREDLVEIQLLGSVLSYWLERQGIAAMHASAVDVGGHAVGFLSSNSGGKTGLAAALMGRGCKLLTDDVLPIEERGGRFLSHSGYPQMRMWPDQASHFLGARQDLEIVHPDYSKRRIPIAGLGEFCPAARPLGCLYLPRRRQPGAASGEVEITRLSPRDAVIELLRQSFSPLIVEAIGWRARRLEFFARLVERVAVCRLEYDSGFDHLPAVCDRLLADVETRLDT